MTMLWQPSDDYINQSELKHFEQWLLAEKSLQFTDYQSLWQWSIEHIDDFWEAVWQYFKVISHAPYQFVVHKNESDMTQTKWFGGATLNYAEHIFRNKHLSSPAIIFDDELNNHKVLSWQDLETQVLAVQEYLISKGVTKGDRVVGVLSNTPEAIVAFLATNSLGAIWSCCSPDFGVDSIIDRFKQIEPKVMFVQNKYHYGGKLFKKSSHIRQVIYALDSLEEVITIDSIQWAFIHSIKTKKTLEFTPVEFHHPIWVLYSSGTTGKPKAITHGTGGNLLEHLKALAFHQNVRAGERFFWYTTTGWMMWNYALSSLLCGATLCIYDGSPAYPNIDILWDFAEKNQIQHFGGGAAFYINYMKMKPQAQKNLSLKTLGSTGSPLPADAFKWLYQHISSDMHLISLSGGTDVCSAFLSGCPYLPVQIGEIQCRTLGSAIEAWNDEGKAVENEVGELIITQPMPSMPVFFWNDIDNERYRASYFEKYPKVWCHGDWIKITENKGAIIYGRSDATLNRDGVRIGTAEIYNAVESLDEVKDSLVVCIEKEDGSAYMPLFVVLAHNQTLSDELKQKIKTEIRSQYSPRHVPDAIIEVSEIPYTISGKKMEMPVKKILMGVPLEKAVTLDAMRNPESIKVFLEML